MHLRLSRAAIASTSLIVFSSIAASQTPLGPERKDIGDLRGDIWAAVTAPARIARGDAVPLATVAGVVALTTIRDSAIYAWMMTHPNTLVMEAIAPMRDNWKFPLYELGSGQYLLPLSAVAYTRGRLVHDADWRDAGMGCASSHLSSALLRDVIYLSVSRVRPHDTAKSDSVWFPGGRVWSHHSFLSGHIANSMACASFLAHRYSMGWGAAPMYAYVTLIGLGRLADGWHWPSDTMAGAAMGFAIGKFIADRQEARRAARTTTAAATPVKLGWSFTF